MSSAQPWWDATALQSFLDRHIGAGVTVGQARRLSGGAIQENWWLQLLQADGDTLDVVFRCDAASVLSESRSRVEEYQLLKVAFEAGVSAPEPLCMGDDSLGRDFFIMRKAQGNAVGHKLVRDPLLARKGEQLATQVGIEMARLHRIQPPEARLGFMTLPVGTPSADGIAQIKAFLEQHRQTHPALFWAVRWLEQHQPSHQRVVLTHRDLRTGNYLVHQGELTAVLDWEFAAWSDPHEDLGWFCARCWRFGKDDNEAGGVGSRAALYAGYEQVSGSKVDAAAVYFWEVYAHLRWAMIALQQGERLISGDESKLELGLTAHIVPELELELLRMTGASPAALARDIPAAFKGASHAH
jgi:aminoglycoside phosphotransferase (APT) family kinase protein